MTVREEAREMDRAELEAVAAGIIARLTGRIPQAETGETAQYTAAKAETGAGLLPAAPDEGSGTQRLWTAVTADAAGTENVSTSAPATVLYPETYAYAETSAPGKEAPGSDPFAPVRGGADMRDISDFFMRDSRRYDNGFEKY